MTHRTNECSNHPSHLELGEVPIGLLRHLPLLDRIALADPALLNMEVAVRRLQAGETVYQEGQDAQHLFLVVTGSFKLVRVSANGQAIAVTLAMRGGGFGGLDLAAAVYPESAVALTTSQVLAFPRAELSALYTRHPMIAQFLIELLAARLEYAEAKIFRLSGAPVRSRVAATLLLIFDNGGGQAEEITLSRHDLASLTGMAPETASRVVSTLQCEGVITSRRENITIVDRHRLAHAADF
ncbi:hypothetical protein GCM10009720_27760 [Yaniella flava]|uniref:Crp/Fnr family transcriptional regulator n=1 Tax=Yaniella flava TaxID=287930 RepID=A0ABP5GGM0_9MICC